jgi:hypothetical protein
MNGMENPHAIAGSPDAPDMDGGVERPGGLTRRGMSGRGPFK